ncbi:MAG: glycoside hydrolase family 140 protein [Eubacteriales bacterium]|jgi:hypothetical protein|nr:glycoside hydrolase family 140 protein [Eubacteriales bacterium]
MKKLCVKGRYLSFADNTPFLYAGDTAWELFHRVNREDAVYYIENRARQGFNAVQAVALAEFEGLTVPNAYGRLPLKFTDGLPDPALPDTDGDYSYWAHVDYIVSLAQKHNMFIVMLPAWGDKFNKLWGKGPEVFNPSNAYTYARFIAERYRDEWNIIWMLGGDRPLDTPEHRAIIDGMARGIHDTGDTHLITFHPVGCRNSLDWLDDADYIDFHTAQTSHSAAQCYKSDEIMLKMAQKSDKPYMDSESRYEDHPACFDASLGYLWNADDTRQNTYWNITAGACGQTYGNHCIWSFNDKPSDYFTYNWKDALTHPGAEQFGFAKKLRLSRDFFSLRPANDMVKTHYPSMGHISASMGDRYAYIYSPLGLPFAADLKIPGGKVLRAAWFDPRNGEEHVFAILNGEGAEYFVPPTTGKGNDWVLILDAVK